MFIANSIYCEMILMTEFVVHPWINPNTIEKRMYQDNITKTALSGNTLCVLPTGLGKTPIAAIVTAGRLQKDMNKKILFLAPTKPLVNQHKKTFEKYLKVGEDELKAVTGTIKPEERKALYEKADVVFATPQTISNDLKRDILHLKNYSLLIVDEAHRCVGNYAYVYIAKKYMQQSLSPLILALTASPGASREKINEIRQRLFIENIEIRARDDSDVRPYIQELDSNWVEVELQPKLKEIKQYLEKAKEEKIKKLMSWQIIRSPMIGKAQIIKLQQELAKRKTGPSYLAMSYLAELLKIDHALLLLETQCLYSLKKYFDKLYIDAGEKKTKAVFRLMKDENFLRAIKLTDEALHNGLEHPKIEKLKEIITAELKNKDARIIVFAQIRDTISRIYNMIKLLPGCGPIEFIGQAKKAGKGLSQKEQVQIINEFKMGFYNVLVATSIAEEGLDITETNAVIFYEPVPSAVRRIQRAGRTARTQPGKVFILMTKNTRDEAYHWVGHHKERRMKKILYDMQNKLAYEKQKDLGEFHD